MSFVSRMTNDMAIAVNYGREYIFRSLKKYEDIVLSEDFLKVIQTDEAALQSHIGTLKPTDIDDYTKVTLRSSLDIDVVEGENEPDIVKIQFEISSQCYMRFDQEGCRQLSEYEKTNEWATLPGIIFEEDRPDRLSIKLFGRNFNAPQLSSNILRKNVLETLESSSDFNIVSVGFVRELRQLVPKTSFETLKKYDAAIAALQ